MTPKEKAEELVYRFTPSTRQYNSEFGWEDSLHYAKEAALISVDEILEICSLDCLTNLHNHEFEAKFNYWQEVKKEIEKL
jgi:hypothetical protein